ncbi:MAG: rod shape-determining protein MreC [Acidimicrobiia bacterium]|nr:rod shape-determining protein MreC [Acidimicrobiia bacterium]
MWRPSGVDRATGVFLGLIVLSLVLVTFDLRGSGGGMGATLRDGTQSLFAPVQRFFGTITSPVVDTFEGIADIVSLREENRRLRDEVSALEAQLQETSALEARVRELENILGVEPPEDLQTITARVFAIGISEFDHVRSIDKGRDAGIAVDMPVVDEGGLVGRIISVTDDTARFRLITDPTMRVAVRVERTGEQGILTGRGTGPMDLEMFNTDAALLEGDLLVSADGRFPSGIVVARVLESARSQVGFSLRTTASPTAELSRIDFVKVLVFTRDAAAVEELPEDEGTPVTVPVEDQGGPSEGEPEETPVGDSTESTP